MVNLVKINRINNFKLLMVHHCKKDKVLDFVKNQPEKMEWKFHNDIKYNSKSDYNSYTCYNILKNHDISHTVPLLGIKSVRYNPRHKVLSKEPISSCLIDAGIVCGDIVDCYYCLDVVYNLRLVKIVINHC